MASARADFRLLALPLLALAAACSGAGADAPAEAPAETEPIRVTVAPVVEAPVERVVSLVGALYANEEVVVTSEAPGRVRETRVDFGETVAAGQLLMTLEPREFEIAVARASAALGEARAVLGLAPDEDEGRYDVEQSPGVARARSELEDAQTKLESARVLVETGDIPRQRFLELETAAAGRAEALRAARYQAQTQLATVAARRAELALAEKHLADTEIRAPFGGLVAERHVAPGQFAAANTPLVTIVQIDPLRLRARVPEAGSAVMARGVQLQFRTNALPGESFAATITDVSPVVDAPSRTLTAEARVANPAGRLRPGMFVEIDAVLAEPQLVKLAPREALVQFAGVTKVYVLRANTDQVEEVEVAPGVASGDRVEIVSPEIAVGESVVTSPVEALRPGQRVVVTP